MGLQTAEYRCSVVEVERKAVVEAWLETLSSEAREYAEALAAYLSKRIPGMSTSGAMELIWSIDTQF